MCLLCGDLWFVFEFCFGVRAKGCLFLPTYHQGSEKTTHFPISTWMKSKETTPAQTQAFWTTVLDDFRDLAVGRTQENVLLAQDAHGRTWRFLLLFCKGDEQVRADEWGLVHYNAANQCCPDCLANRSTHPFSDLQASADWRTTVITDLDTYMNRFRVPRHPLAASPFAWRHFSCWT
jgi:hypothetical protein